MTTFGRRPNTEGGAGGAGMPPPGSMSGRNARTAGSTRPGNTLLQNRGLLSDSPREGGGQSLAEKRVDRLRQDPGAGSGPRQQ